MRSCAICANIGSLRSPQGNDETRQPCRDCSDGERFSPAVFAKDEGGKVAGEAVSISLADDKPRKKRRRRGMDNGNGQFVEVPEPALGFVEKAAASGVRLKGVFREGEYLELRGSKFRVETIQPEWMRLKLMPAGFVIPEVERRESKGARP